MALLYPAVGVLIASTVGAAAPTDQAIRGVLDAQVAAWNKGDLDGFMAGYWNDDKLF
jgi:beta-aspartyl-peptidase (threonine type)